MGSLTTREPERSGEVSRADASLVDLRLQSGSEYDLVSIIGLLVGISGMRMHSESNRTLGAAAAESKDPCGVL